MGVIGYSPLPPAPLQVVPRDFFGGILGSNQWIDTLICWLRVGVQGIELLLCPRHEMLICSGIG